jgi:hypothetical protein
MTRMIDIRRGAQTLVWVRVSVSVFVAGASLMAMTACGSGTLENTGTPGPPSGGNAQDVGGRNTPPALVGGTPAAGLSGSTNSVSTPLPTPTR